jgi:FG-GAP-like repeat/FG-GAP repeat
MSDSVLDPVVNSSTLRVFSPVVARPARGGVGSLRALAPVLLALAPALAGCAADGGRIVLGDRSDQSGLADRDGNCPGGCMVGSVCDTQARVCVDEPGVPVLTAPLAGAVVTGRPVFAWRTASNADESVVEICADVDCASILATITGATGGVADVPLARGGFFVRGYGRRARADGTWIVAATPTRARAVFSTGRDVVSSALLSMAPDLDGDGRADLVVANDFPPAGQGSATLTAYLAHAVTTATSASNATDGAFADRAVLAGDIDGDGLVEIATAARAPQYNGGNPDALPILRLGLNADGDLVELQQHTVLGLDGLVALGDVDGDGYADVGVVHDLPMVSFVYDSYGDSYWVQQGATLEILFGGPDGWSRTSSVTFTIPDDERSPTAMTFRGVGDVDGDGYADLAVGTHATLPDGDCRSIDERDHVEIYRGGPDGTFANVLARVDGVHEVAPLGDVDGDGLADFGAVRSWYVAKQPAQYGSGTCAGSWQETGLVPSEARVYYGGGASPLRATTWALPVNQDPGCADQSGAYDYSDQYPVDGWITAAGDLDGDGFAEVAIASQSHHPGGEKKCWSSGGRVYVYRGGATGAETTPWQVLAGTDGLQATFPRLVRALGSTGDAGGDELAVSAGQDRIVWSGDTGVPPKVRVYAGSSELVVVRTISSYVNPYYADGLGSNLLGGL